METDVTSAIRLVFAGLFGLTLFAGYLLAKNYQKLFGVDPLIPSENDSARAFSKLQAFVIWIHALGLTGSMALFLH